MRAGEAGGNRAGRASPPAERIVRLAILDTYGVRWSREIFARDLLQNFFDATPDFRDIALRIRPEEGVVEIRGPVVFELDLLNYIGATTKTTGRTVGGFGEGFKICALVGTRDFGITMTAGSGAEALTVSLDPVPLGRELCYRVRACETPIEGSFVRLEGCDAACIAAFAAAPSMFRHPENKKLSTPLVLDEEQGVAVYVASSGRVGEIYYRRQLRGTFPYYATGRERPLSLVHDGVIDALEGDRDRRDLPVRPVARAIGEKLSPEHLHRVLLHLMQYWRYGSDVLRGFMEAAAGRKLRFDWPSGWLARAKPAALVTFAERQGFQTALADFADIGMRTPNDHYKNLETRPAEPLERARIQVAAQLYGALLGEPAPKKAYEVFDSDRAAVLGQHLGEKVIVASKLLAGGLDEAAGTILHELSHEVGGEEDRRFLGRLTRLIGAVIAQPEMIQSARERYATASPVEPEEEAEGKAEYAPHDPDLSERDINGIPCNLVVPPAFPPSKGLLDALAAAARALGVHLWVMPRVVRNSSEATMWMGRGLPTLWIADIDPEPPPEQSEPGYRLRTYGSDGQKLWPSDESLRRALLEAKEKGLTGRKGERASYHVIDAGLAKLAERSGKATPEPAKPEPPKPAEPSSRERERDSRDMKVLRKIEEDTGYASGYSFSEFWGLGRRIAAEQKLQEYKDSTQSAESVFSEIEAHEKPAMVYARRLRTQDPDFDDGSEFERSAMAAAQGAAVLAFCEAQDEALAKQRADEHFQAVRKLTGEIFDLDTDIEAKTTILHRVLLAAGFSHGHVDARSASLLPKRGVDLQRLPLEFERLRDIALRVQSKCDEEGLGAAHILMEQAFHSRKKSEEEQRADERREREKRAWVKRSWAIKRVYDEALAESGSIVVAAGKCLEAAHKPEEE
jgi:hypothetical protein